MITNANELITPFDNIPSNRANRIKDYQRGVKVGLAATEFHISYSGTWSATNKNGSSVGSYEKLGYHANTAYFFLGVMLSGVTIIDHRDNDPLKAKV